VHVSVHRRERVHHPSCAFFFFFQAEDGIRDGHVTGVQTCALPILIVTLPVVLRVAPITSSPIFLASGSASPVSIDSFTAEAPSRSEERRVGKECRCRWAR